VLQAYWLTDVEITPICIKMWYWKTRQDEAIRLVPKKYLKIPSPTNQVFESWAAYLATDSAETNQLFPIETMWLQVDWVKDLSGSANLNLMT